MPYSWAGIVPTSFVCSNLNNSKTFRGRLRERAGRRKRIMRKIFTLFSMFMLCLGIGAQTETSLIEAYKIYVPDQTVQAGGTAQLYLYMDNRNAIAVWDCTLVLPENVTYEDAALYTEAGCYTEAYNAEFTKQVNNDGSVSFHCEGEEGVGLVTTSMVGNPIAVVTVSIPSTVTAGKYNVTTKGIKLTEVSGTIHNYTNNNSEVTTELTIEEAVATYYTLTYIVDGEIYQTYQVEYGAEITPEAEPEKEGYTFSGWSEIPATMPDHDVEVTGTFTINTYFLTYVVDGEEYKRYEVEYGAEITPEADPEKEGYTFSGWSEIPATMPAHDVDIIGEFHVNSYTLIYKVDGEEYMSYTVEFGAEITPEAEPTKDGYTFSGWSEIPATMPAHDVEVTGTFTINTHTLRFVVDNTEMFSISVEYGTELAPIAEKVSETMEEKEGYTFYWIDEIPETMPDYDLTIQGAYDVNYYGVEFYMGEGGELISGQEVAYGDPIPVPDDPTREGYTFIGWEPAIPDAMPAEDLTFVAQWQINTYTVEVIGDYAQFVTVSNTNPTYGETVTISVLPDVDFASLWIDEGNGAYDVRDMMEGYTYTVEKVSFNFTVEAIYNVDPVGITGVQQNSSKDAIFDMQGRRVNKMNKGIYIVNGKKIAVK